MSLRSLHKAPSHKVHKVHKVPKLPILTIHNKSKFPQWHHYIQRVYHQTVTTPIDLNTFTWFYYYAPFNISIQPRRFIPRKAFECSSTTLEPTWKTPCYWLDEQHIVEYPNLKQAYLTCLKLTSNEKNLSQPLLKWNVKNQNVMRWYNPKVSKNTKRLFMKK